MKKLLKMFLKKKNVQNESCSIITYGTLDLRLLVTVSADSANSGERYICFSY